MSGIITVSSTTDSQEAVDAAADYGEQTLPFPDEEKPGTSSEVAETGTVADSETAEPAEIEEEEPEEESPEEPEAEASRMGPTRRGLAAQVRRQAAKIDELEEIVRKLSPAESAKPKSEPLKRPEVADPKYRGKDMVDVISDTIDFKEQEKKAAEVREQQQAVEREQQEIAKEVIEDYKQQLDVAKSKYEDFYDVVHPVETTLPQWLQERILVLPNAAEVSYYLGKHPKEVEQLMAWDEPRSRAGLNRMIARVTNISDQLDTGITPQVPSSSSPQPRMTAPRPLRHVGGASTTTAVNPDKFKTQREYNDWRNNGGGR